ncbi:MAG TPA: hypothetical protein VOA80_17200 [Thermoanaerobaculia bacterium]|nr:hypothetical protein [Thermoanaerobaculia bacterium]
MKSLTLSRAEIEAAGIGAYFRPRDLGPLAISFPELQRLVAAGSIEKVGRKPASVPTAIRIVRFSGPMLTYGVERHSILGVPLRITSPARTVVDCLRYRNKLGLDVALEALREALRMRITTVDEIARAAEVCRSRTVMRPYLEVLAS